MAGEFAVTANLTLPRDFAAPAGGVRLRLRVPLEHKGKLAAVTVGGKPWSSFNAVAETVAGTSPCTSVPLPLTASRPRMHPSIARSPRCISARIAFGLRQVDFAQSDFATEDQRAATQSIKATFN